MFSKQGLIIATAAGAGVKKTIRDMKDSMDYWGVAKTYTYGKSVAAANWQGVPQKKRDQIEKDIKIIAAKITKRHKKVRPVLKIRGLFYAMRFVHKKFKINKPDIDYWNKLGWLGKTRPW